MSTGKQVKRDLRSLAWSILGQEDVTDVLKDTEDQVETKMVRMVFPKHLRKDAHLQ